MSQTSNNCVLLGASVFHWLSTTDAEIIAVGDVPVASYFMLLTSKIWRIDINYCFYPKFFLLPNKM